MEKNKASDQVDITAPILPEDEPKKTYAEVFLEREEIKERKSVYIDKKTHIKISRLVHAFALSGVEISVGSYIDNIINRASGLFQRIYFRVLPERVRRSIIMMLWNDILFQQSYCTHWW